MKSARRGGAAGPLLVMGVALLSLYGCGSLRRTAISSAADALAGDRAAEVYTSDDDPELVRDAFPFVLKTTELLIAEDPSNRSLHLSAGSGFVQYASVFLDDEADMMEDVDFKRSRELRKRAAKLYFRGCEYALAGLEIENFNFRERLRTKPDETLTWMEERDVPLLFWAGAGWLGAIAADPSNMERVAEFTLAEAVMRRVLELDNEFGSGIVHEFFITFEGARSEAMGGSAERAWEHYRRAVALTDGRKASPHVALAATVAVQQQDLKTFRDLLGKALAVDENEVRKWRLSNVLARRKAQWLLDRTGDLFVEFEEGKE